MTPFLLFPYIAHLPLAQRFQTALPMPSSKANRLTQQNLFDGHWDAAIYINSGRQYAFRSDHCPPYFHVVWAARRTTLPARFTFHPGSMLRGGSWHARSRPRPVGGACPRPLHPLHSLFQLHCQFHEHISWLTDQAMHSHPFLDRSAIFEWHNGGWRLATTEHDRPAIFRARAHSVMFSQPLPCFNATSQVWLNHVVNPDLPLSALVYISDENRWTLDDMAVLSPRRTPILLHGHYHDWHPSCTLVNLGQTLFLNALPTLPHFHARTPAPADVFTTHLRQLAFPPHAFLHTFSSSKLQDALFLPLAHTLDNLP